MSLIHSTIKCVTGLLLVGVLAVACKKEPEPIPDTPKEEKPAGEAPGTALIATASDFEAATKIALSASCEFSWSIGDFLGVAPVGGAASLSRYVLTSLDPSRKTAVFDNSSSILAQGVTYAAYYPYQGEDVKGDGTISFSLEGQRQKSNDNTSHLGAFDLMYAKAVVPAEGSPHFDFSHKVCLLKVNLPIKGPGAFTSLVLAADGDCFSRVAVMSMSDGSVSATDRTAEITLELENVSFPEDGGNLVAWISVLASGDICGKTLAASLVSTDGRRVSYEILSCPDKLVGGRVYDLVGRRESDVVFSDDFSWLSPFITDGCADFVNGAYPDLETRIATGNSNSINLYNTYPDTFPSAFAAAGYADKAPSNKTIYGQGTRENPYLKFCKGNTQTALVLQPFSGAYGEVQLSLDWAVHMTASALDEVDLQFRIEGEGQFADGTKVSRPFELSQTSVSDPTWSKASAVLTGVNSTTRIVISSRQAFEGGFSASGQHRFYIDNIRISTDCERENEPVGPEPGSTVYGVVTCEGRPVAGAVVSDGHEVVCTGANGIYQMKSKKENGYVFISIPSGYEVESDGVLPLFHKRLVEFSSAAERVDFELLSAGDQTNHTMLYLGDMHLANRTNDKAQFKRFTTELAEYVSAHPSEKIYAITLGDMTWDLYWYSRNFCFEQYLAEYKGVLNGLQIFHNIGNHDHDMNATGDWDTMLRFRRAICPNYYSFNIGKIHYVVVDDIECTNNPASTTDGSGRSYKTRVVGDIMNWLRKDLSFVDKSTPVVVTMHAPVYTKDSAEALDNTSELASLFNGYNVTFVSGHTHVCYTVDKSSSIREYNSGAVCAAWWWAGKYNPDYNIATDGSPAGYRIASVKGKEQSSYFKATGRSADYQFRAYDRNKINFDLSMVPSGGQNALMKELALSVIYGNYSGGSSSNDVIINVWDWNKNWKVEVTENGKSLPVSQKTLMDPSFYSAYTVPHLNAGNTSVTWHPSPTNHMFVVRASSATSTLSIRVTDDEGRVYTEEMRRPREFKISAY